MKLKISIFILVLVMVVAFDSSAQNTIGSKWEMGALIYHEYGNYGSIYDAMGTNVTKYLDDFVYWDGDTLSTATFLNPWIISRSGATDSSIITHLDSLGGVICLGAGSDSADGVNLQLDGESFKLDSLNTADIIYFGARLMIVEDSSVWANWGLTITDTKIFDGVSDGMYFRMGDDSGTVSFVTESSNGEKTSLVGSIPAGTYTAGQYNIWEFYWDSRSSAVSVYRDGTFIATHTTQIPYDEELTITFEYYNAANGLTAVQPEMAIDWVRAVMIRVE